MSCVCCCPARREPTPPVVIDMPPDYKTVTRPPTVDRGKVPAPDTEISPGVSSERAALLVNTVRKAQDERSTPGCAVRRLGMLK
ncbi:MAG: hypothetical protein OXF02_04250 [Simkaniaceae bacterium]|nr:hypothetical protein [Simkaniaceae bacterium]